MEEQKDPLEPTLDPTHVPGIRRGEEGGDEPGRYDTGTTGADRPTGTSTARDSTSIDPEAAEPIDPRMPNMPPA